MVSQKGGYWAPSTDFGQLFHNLSHKKIRQDALPAIRHYFIHLFTYCRDGMNWRKNFTTIYRIKWKINKLAKMLKIPKISRNGMDLTTIVPSQANRKLPQ